MAWPTPRAQDDLLRIIVLANAAGRTDVTLPALACTLHPEVLPPVCPTVAEHEHLVFLARTCVELGDFDSAVPLLEHTGGMYGFSLTPRANEEELRELAKMLRRALEGRVQNLQEALSRLEEWLDARKGDRKKRGKKGKGGD